ncbi:hypothetical protein [Thermodesulfovibrio hydrogeniphilus]
MKKTLAGVLTTFFALSSFTSFACAQDLKPVQVFESKCSKCHSIDRPKSQKKTADEWRRTVKRMQSKKNANINDAEAETIIKYLSENYGK